jgi:ketosteroid isomerase-like protein
MKPILVMAGALVAIGLSGLIHVTGKGIAPPEVPPASQELYGEIKRMDAALSDAFNAHDINKLKALFTEDLEFYQDNEGLTRYEQTVRDFESLFAQGNKMRRELVEGSLEVYPIKDYGAMEIGAHRFCHVENGKDECGTFRFVHLWRRGGGAWKISRVVSYAH